MLAILFKVYRTLSRLIVIIFCLLCFSSEIDRRLDLSTTDEKARYAYFIDSLAQQSELEIYLPARYRARLRQYAHVDVIALASFPANDLMPSKGNGITFFERQASGRFKTVSGKQGDKTFPLKVAARPYSGRHTAYRSVFLESPVGIFEMHKGSRNGSRYVSWAPSTRRMMARANYVPCFGLKVEASAKPQRHFHYAVHTTPAHYTERHIQQKKFASLGCFSLLVSHMRTMYEIFSAYPSDKRLFISLYDTMSYDAANRKFYLYQDIYKRGVNTSDQFYLEMRRYHFDERNFDDKKVEDFFNLASSSFGFWQGKDYRAIAIDDLLRSRWSFFDVH